MPRIRTIKPEFWTDEKIIRLSRDARLFFIGLWNFADDNGVLEADPLQLKARIFPIDVDITEEVIVELIKELKSLDIVKEYEYQGKKYLLIVNFKKHQKIDRPRKSNLPLPEEIYQAKNNKNQDISGENKRNHLKSSEISCNQLISDEINSGKEKEGKGSINMNNKVVVSNDTTCPQARLVDGSDVNPSSKNCPHQEIINLYHKILPELPRVKVWNATRQKLLRARWREDPQRQNLEWWRKFFLYVRKCPFLMGQVVTKDGRTFQADLEWLIKPQNFVKVLEGRYRQKGWEGKVSSITLHNLRAAQEFLRKYEGEENEDS